MILGRRNAGKTIYLARLYELCWGGQDVSGIHMMAREGSMHVRLMQVLAELERGEWPQATGAGRQETFVFDVTFDGKVVPLVTIEYGGEDFTSAFVADENSEVAEALRDHVDRAIAVLILADPLVALQGEAEEASDDDYGMVRAIQRIRDMPGGKTVPIVMMLTKWDERIQMVSAEGGMEAFVHRWYANLFRVSKQLKIFTCAAVRTRTDARGRACQIPPCQRLVLSSLWCIAWRSCPVEPGRARRPRRRRSKQSSGRNSMLSSGSRPGSVGRIESSFCSL